MDNAKLRAIGWKPFFEQQVSSEVLETMVVARVSAPLRKPDSAAWRGGRIPGFPCG